MVRGDATMPFALVEGLERAEALLPLRGERVPRKPQRVEPLTTLRRHAVSAPTLNPDPQPQSKVLLAMVPRHATMPFALVKARQKTEAFLPLRGERVPHKL